VLVSKIERDVRAAESGETYERVAASLLRREVDPYDAAEELLG
jgi:hypothetical protein